MFKKMRMSVLVLLFGAGMVGNLVGAVELPPPYQEAIAEADFVAGLICKECGYVNNVVACFCNMCGVSLGANAGLAPEVAQQIGARLREAARQGRNWELQQLLSQYPALVDAADENGQVPLLCAVQRQGQGTVKTVEILAEARANVDTRDKVFGLTPLMVATHFGKEDRARALLASKASIDLQQIEGSTALHCAVAYEQQEMIPFLIQQNAALDVQDDEGLTPLMRCQQLNNIEGMKLLLDASASVNLASRYHLIPLTAAIDSNQWNAVKALLARKELCKNQLWVRDVDGRTPLMRVIYTDVLFELVEELIVKGRKYLDHQDNRAETALSLAADKGKKEIVRALLKAKASLSIRADNGITALANARLKGHVGIEQILAEAEAREEHVFARRVLK